MITAPIVYSTVPRLFLRQKYNSDKWFNEGRDKAYIISWAWDYQTFGNHLLFLLTIYFGGCTNQEIPFFIDVLFDFSIKEN